MQPDDPTASLRKLLNIGGLPLDGGSPTPALPGADPAIVHSALPGADPAISLAPEPARRVASPAQGLPPGLNLGGPPAPPLPLPGMPPLGQLAPQPLFPGAMPADPRAAAPLPGAMLPGAGLPLPGADALSAGGLPAPAGVAPPRRMLFERAAGGGCEEEPTARGARAALFGDGGASALPSASSA